MEINNATDLLDALKELGLPAKFSNKEFNTVWVQVGHRYASSHNYVGTKLFTKGNSYSARPGQSVSGEEILIWFRELFGV